LTAIKLRYAAVSGMDESQPAAAGAEVLFPPQPANPAVAIRRVANSTPARGRRLPAVVEPTSTPRFTFTRMQCAPHYG
jgi:hypothetical protein